MNTRLTVPWLVAMLTLAVVGPARGHGGADHDHDHAAAPMPVGAEAPSRLADGGVFVPKISQHRLGLRTLPATPAELAVTLELTGTVIADPGAGGRVQAAQAGRVEPLAGGLPTLGQRVARGQALARLRPITGTIERAGQTALLAELDAGIALLEGRLARYAQLEGAIPGKEVEAARIELTALRQRRAAIDGGLRAGETLTAPVAGVISAAHVMPGQIVDARETLFEIVDPDRLAVEALAYDPALTAGIHEASLLLPDGERPLRFIGAGRQLRAQAQPLLFRVLPGAGAPSVGQPARVLARAGESQRGVALPTAALLREGGVTMVWVKLAPERFAPRRVEARPLDGGRVAITAGLTEGERVVVRGASLLGQIR